MVSRADTLTQTSRKKEYYSDFLDSFAASPIGGNLAKLTNEQAVKQSIKNLVLTNIGERLYQPKIGSDVLKSLFEPNSPYNFLVLKNNIEACIKYYEPRAKAVEIKVYPSDCECFIYVDIVFYVINNSTQQTVNLTLKRIR
jgi:phage baseplate assembly protein W